MKEFSMTWDSKDLIRGLRKSSRNPKNNFAFTELINLKVRKEFGLGPYESLTDPFTGLNFDFPFPQLFRGRSDVYLATASRLYSVNPAATPWTATEVLAYDTKGDIGDIRVGGHWQIADFFDSYIMVNGLSNVFKSKWQYYSTGQDVLVADNAITIQTCCGHRGRMIFGGFSESNFWSSAWQTFWAAQANTGKITFDFTQGLGSNFVLWSNIGEGLFWLFYPTLGQGALLESAYATASAYGSSRPRILEMFERNDLGFAAMPWLGTVYKVLPIGKNLAVYGTGGITILIPITEPEPTYGMIEITNLSGIKSRGSVAGDEHNHLVVMDNDELWTLGEDLSFVKLDYKEFIAELNATEIVVSHDQLNKEFYICDGEKTYLLTEVGLSRVRQLVTSVITYNGVSYGATRVLGL